MRASTRRSSSKKMMTHTTTPATIASNPLLNAKTIHPRKDTHLLRASTAIDAAMMLTGS